MATFTTPGLIDMRSVQFMGLSAKLSDNPIGQFGTGLKYAIAVSLRHDCTFTLWRGKEKYTFFSREENFRGKSVSLIYMQQGTAEFPLGITTHLGEHWDMWMALRELESNTRDEGGVSRPGNAGPSADTTTIVVDGPAMELAYSKLGEIFLDDTTKLWSSPSLDIHTGRSKYLYYRGVRCMKLEKPSCYTYNILSTQELTEDRTFKYTFIPVAALTRGIIGCSNGDILDKVLTCNEGFAEHHLDYASRVTTFPEPFVAAVMRNGFRAQKNAYVAVKRSKGESEFEAIPLDSYHQTMVTRAQDFLTRMGFHNISEYPVIMANLGADTLGTVRGKTLYLAPRTFELGYKQVVSTLLEEYIHADRGYADCTYTMQNFLFDSVITHAARHLEEVL